MVHRYTSMISKFRWAVIAFWIAATVASMLWLPSLNTVVAHKATNFLPDTTPVIQAGKLLSQISPSTSAGSTAVVAIHNPQGLSQNDVTYFHDQLSAIANNRAKYGVQSVQDAVTVGASAASNLRSADHTTEIALIGFPGADVSMKTASALQSLKAAFAHAPGNSHVYFTGDAPIQQDDNTISQDGVQKTAGVTVALVLIILLLVFRSVVAPLVTLISIGVSFLISSGLVAWLAGYGLPVSSFTQTFMVAILFGAGTDYSIIMMNRYREELTKGEDHLQTLLQTVRAIGKTILFSSLTVIVSFAVLYFANFGLYRSAVGVSIGVLVTLLVCVTLIPAVMDVLRRYLFWPRKPKVGVAHKPSAIWNGSARISLRRPWLTLLALAIVLVPIASLFTNERTFDPMNDIPTAPSVTGFRVVSDAFGPGNVLPMNLVIDSPGNLRTPQGLATIAAIGKAVGALSSVSKVESATQPTGTPITALQLAKQNDLTAQGLVQIQSGLSTLGNHLLSAAKSTTSAAQGSTALVHGAAAVASGAAQLQQGLASAANGSGQLASGTARLASGSASEAAGLRTLAHSTGQLAAGTGQLSQGLQKSATAQASVAQGAAQVSTGSGKVSDATRALANAIAAWTKAHPDLATNPSWQQIVQLAAADAQGAAQTHAGAAQVSAGTAALDAALAKLSGGAQNLAQGTQQLTGGTTKLAAGAAQIAQGVQSAADGAASLKTGLGKLQGGSVGLSSGTQKVATGVQSLQSGFGQLAGGLQQAGAATGKLAQGVSKVNTALTQSGQSARTGDPGFYVPASALSNAGLQKAMNAYISPSGHVANITVVLKDNPYSLSALQQVAKIEQATRLAMAASPMSQGTITAAGPTAVQSALNQISTLDFTRTITFILVAIFLLLCLMLRSILTPLYIMASLMATYGVTMGVLQTIAVHVLDKPGLSWPVPFFVFLLLVALGVDYSIFVFSRFDEELGQGKSPKEAMQHAMGQMGNVIFSAALIMGGTFGSMIVAGVTSLTEIGLGIVVGLFLYAFVLLGFFAPALASVVDMGHFWPFRRSQHKARTASDPPMPGVPSVRDAPVI